MYWLKNSLHSNLNCYIPIPLVLFSGFVAWIVSCLNGCDVHRTIHQEFLWICVSTIAGNRRECIYAIAKCRKINAYARTIRTPRIHQLKMYSKIRRAAFNGVLLRDGYNVRTIHKTTMRDQSLCECVSVDRAINQPTSQPTKLALFVDCTKNRIALWSHCSCWHFFYSCFCWCVKLNYTLRLVCENNGTNNNNNNSMPLCGRPPFSIPIIFHY